jgi:hypothetical protein
MTPSELNNPDHRRCTTRHTSKTRELFGQSFALFSKKGNHRPPAVLLPNPLYGSRLQVRQRPGFPTLFDASRSPTSKPCLSNRSSRCAMHPYESEMALMTPGHETTRNLRRCTTSQTSKTRELFGQSFALFSKKGNHRPPAVLLPDPLYGSRLQVRQRPGFPTLFDASRSPTSNSCLSNRSSRGAVRQPICPANAAAEPPGLVRDPETGISNNHSETNSSLQRCEERLYVSYTQFEYRGHLLASTLFPK